MRFARSLTTRQLPVTAAVVIAVAAAIPAFAASHGEHSRMHAHAADAHHAQSHKLTVKQLAFHDAMRKLWEDHVTWTRLAIVSYISELPDLQTTEARLLKNQVDIGNAIKPFYGKKAGAKLTSLLKQHILGAVDLMAAAKGGDQAAVANASTAWNANGRQIADFLHAANPSAWPAKEMRSMMQVHLDQTLKEAVDRFGGKHAAEVRDYDAIHAHILEMADMLSDGIITQFPARFR
jgi:hypothetical protein